MGVNFGVVVEKNTLGMLGICGRGVKGDINALGVLGYEIWRVHMEKVEFERHVGGFSGEKVDGAFRKPRIPALYRVDMTI